MFLYPFLEGGGSHTAMHLKSNVYHFNTHQYRPINRHVGLHGHGQHKGMQPCTMNKELIQHGLAIQSLRE